MGFWSLFVVATMPILQVLIISALGAFMATGYSNLLNNSARSSLNKIVFIVFTPSLMFASLAKTVTLQDIISWWYMPINIGLTFLFGGILGWMLVKILRPKEHLEGLIIATCSSGNLGNLLLIIAPAICNEGSPFGDHKTCSSVGLSYASFSMALGGFYIWTYTYQLIKTSSVKHKALDEAAKAPNKDLDAHLRTNFLENEDSQSIKTVEDPADQSIKAHESANRTVKQPVLGWSKLKGILQQILKELLAPPTLAAILGFIFGATQWLRNLLVGTNAPLRVIQDTIKLLGDGTIPCITLIMGGNLTQGLRASRIKPLVIVGVVLVRYVVLPVIGIWIVKAADKLGFLPVDPLFRYVLLIQFTLPPAMNIGTMTQLFDVAQEECSVIFMWTYLAAAIALTLWSTVNECTFQKRCGNGRPLLKNERHDPEDIPNDIELVQNVYLTSDITRTLSFFAEPEPRRPFSGHLFADEIAPLVAAPLAPSLLASRSHRRQLALAVDEKASADAPNKWEEMSAREKAHELYMGEKGLLFWLKKTSEEPNKLSNLRSS